MRFMRVVFVGFLLSLFSNSYAGSALQARIEIVKARGGDRVFFKTNTYTDVPACAAAVQEWVVDVSTPTGMVLFSSLLSAASDNRLVNVYGTGNCTAWADREDVYQLDVIF